MRFRSEKLANDRVIGAEAREFRWTSSCYAESTKHVDEVLTKRCPEERQKGRGEEEDSPCCSFNSIEFYSSVQLISLRSPLKSSLSFVAYCFTLRSATDECTYVRFSFTSVPAPLTGLKESQTRGSSQLRIETVVDDRKTFLFG